MGDLQASIDRAVLVLTREGQNAAEMRRKFEPGGSLYMLIEKNSPAAIERVALIDREIVELQQAVDYLERDRI